MLGFGDGEGRQIEKREERQRVALLFFFCVRFFYFLVFIGCFYRVFEKVLFFCFLFFGFRKVFFLDRKSVV